jgi:hypothetical protein
MKEMTNGERDRKTGERKDDEREGRKGNVTKKGT